jgi:hypothetical protein
LKTYENSSLANVLLGARYPNPRYAAEIEKSE